LILDCDAYRLQRWNSHERKIVKNTTKEIHMEPLLDLHFFKRIPCIKQTNISQGEDLQILGEPRKILNSIPAK